MFILIYFKKHPYIVCSLKYFFVSQQFYNIYSIHFEKFLKTIFKFLDFRCEKLTFVLQ